MIQVRSRSLQYDYAHPSRLTHGSSTAPPSVWLFYASGMSLTSCISFQTFNTEGICTRALNTSLNKAGADARCSPLPRHLVFVESDGAVSIEAAHAAWNTSVQGLTWVNIPGLGKTGSGVTPWPRGGKELNFTAGAGPSM